jgi:hypothetical protein
MKWAVFIVGALLCLEAVTQGITSWRDVARAGLCLVIGSGLCLAALLL